MQTAQPTRAITQYQWRVTIDGADGDFIEARAQVVSTPTISISEEDVSGGGKNYNEKVGGKIEFGDLTIQNLILDDEDKDWAWEMLRKRLDPVTGRRGTRAETLVTINVSLTGSGEGGTFRDETYEGQLREVSKSEMDSRASGLVIETCVFSINRRI